MLTTETGTQTRILAAAKTEFLEKGFRNASLRTIVKLAGVTTGAFYGGTIPIRKPSFLHS